ncbi:MAG: hypothetical protein KGJ64_03145, partial [Betaproteobacteria bacterium]|nr:hypothetical protein [Betaproteobacteria bacterium]
MFRAAFSGYLVMRGRVAYTLRRGALRVSGSCAGALLVTLVPDSYAHPDMHAGFDRLLGVAVGIALLEPVLLAWQVLYPLRGAGA